MKLSTIFQSVYALSMALTLAPVGALGAPINGSYDGALEVRSPPNQYIANVLNNLRTPPTRINPLALKFETYMKSNEAAELMRSRRFLAYTGRDVTDIMDGGIRPITCPTDFSGYVNANLNHYKRAIKAKATPGLDFISLHDLLYRAEVTSTKGFKDRDWAFVSVLAAAYAQGEVHVAYGDVVDIDCHFRKAELPVFLKLGQVTAIISHHCTGKTVVGDPIELDLDTLKQDIDLQAIGEGIDI